MIPPDAGFVPVEIEPGLFRWTAMHPDWQAGSPPESTGDGPEAIG